MRAARLAGAIALLLGAGAGACGAQQPGDAMVLSSDRVLVDMASALLPDLAARSGLALREPVRIERRSRQQLTRYLQSKLDEELPPDEARATVEAYALLGLVPPDLDLRAVLLGLYTEQVAGFYEPDSTALFVMDDQREQDLEGLLVHELVHALQDQNTELEALTDQELGNDRSIAAQAAIEGHATLVMVEYLTERMVGVPVDVAAVPDFAAQVRPLLQGIRSQFPALANAPRVIQESLLFPYVEGTGFVQALWAEGRREAPFGARLPASTEQVLERGRGGPPIELDVSVGGGRVVHDEVLGRLELGIFLEEHGVEDMGIADAWEGDRYALVELPGGRRALAWYVLWEAPAARAAFMRAMQAVLPRLGSETHLDAVDVGGRPATLLRVGTIGEVTARVRVGP